MENGIKLKNWVVTNAKWLIVMTIIIISNYFILANKVENNVRDIEVNTTSIKNINTELKIIQSKGLVSKDLAKEIKYNLRAVAEKLGLTYIEDLDKMK